MRGKRCTLLGLGDALFALLHLLRPVAHHLIRRFDLLHRMRQALLPRRDFGQFLPRGSQLAGHLCALPFREFCLRHLELLCRGIRGSSSFRERLSGCLRLLDSWLGSCGHRCKVDRRLLKRRIRRRECCG